MEVPEVLTMDTSQSCTIAMSLIRRAHSIRT